MSEANEQRIIETWRINGQAWANAVREGDLESRKLVTNRAIVEAVMEHSVGSVLDVGCGEGWLARELAAKGRSVIGMDAVPGLIDAASNAGGGTFHLASYEDIAAGRFHCLVDTIVCNFSLLGEKSVSDLFAAIPGLLTPEGALIVQTLHPLASIHEPPYADGWRQGSWCGLGSGFTRPAPWYFRTLSSWIALFKDNGFRVRALREPIHPKTQMPASIIFVGTRDA
ncbi:class I SAM-dependent methyltransferase [Halomonas sp. HP20-15]|uniref:class I SAM-dependent methyltransferase n=1 Tax=Halomonas sp. HP20-15 TaxID=3085901 RepID=UPI0029816E74|nr:class I SAM-dependent methyltransferase [Halomonas sp. HP20-15]MDW5377740.1 class I SAM-dependent methyltransferase [Halomonas sp. HP20-15]